jgi:predicted MPP superfamily phosphohydrolase
MTHRPPDKPLLRAMVRPPYRDDCGHKGWFERISRAQPHVVRRLNLSIDGWPRTMRPLRIAFLSDFHTGSHAGDVGRLAAIVRELAAEKPDLVLHGGDFVNMQPFGGGRVPPGAVAAILAALDAPLGRFAVLGNHDYTYGADEVAAALEAQGITVLNDERRVLRHEGHDIDLLGIPDAREMRVEGKALLRELLGGRPTIVLAHDPDWFRHVPSGPHLTLAGHTHAGQVRFPFIGALRNASGAPLRWSYGHIVEGGRHLYVTAGLGTSAIPLRLGALPEVAVIDVGG